MLEPAGAEFGLVGFACYRGGLAARLGDQMHLSLAPLHARRVDVLDGLLRGLAAQLGSEFSIVADGGAAVGARSQAFAAALQGENVGARIYCYEPLPENLDVLRENVGADPSFVIRPVAISDNAGPVSFTVPLRVPIESGPWRPGTSYAGFIGDPVEWYESITVEAVRLEDEELERFDFVKLDLQGGEYRALVGMGEKLARAKLLYIEHDLRNATGVVPRLRDHGFTILVDGIAFGSDGPLPDLDRFAALGVQVTGSRVLPTEGGQQLYVSAYLEPRTDVLQTDSLTLKPDLLASLEALGVTWIQTDIVAVHPSIGATASDVLDRL